MQDFTGISQDRILYRDEYFFIIWDGYPVNPGHLLIISNAVRKDFFELSDNEKTQLPRTIEKAKEIINQEYKPDGYNIGMNCGETAGQSVFHFHCHVIPRYIGDMDNPKGGVRHVIPDKGNY
jgi:diadenosine tetraphosphate (Ap4A) HIT family hydrolase